MFYGQGIKILGERGSSYIYIEGCTFNGKVEGKEGSRIKYRLLNFKIHTDGPFHDKHNDILGLLKKSERTPIWGIFQSQ